jgi:hypothetical protein
LERTGFAGTDVKATPPVGRPYLHQCASLSSAHFPGQFIEFGRLSLAAEGRP